MKKIICILLACVFALAFVSCKEDKTQTDYPLYAEFEGYKICMGYKAEDALTALGEYKSKSTVGDCGGRGAQVKYSYDSFDLYVLESKDGGNIIDGITFRDDMIETQGGAYIGQGADDAREALKTALGEPTKSEDNSITYTLGSTAMIVGFADGKVAEIDYITE